MADATEEFSKYNLSGCFDLHTLAESRPKRSPTGFKKFDELLGGGLAAELYVLGAVSSLGKSTLLLQIAEEISSKGTPVLYFSLEMPRKNIAFVSVSRESYKRKKPISISELMKDGKKDKELAKTAAACAKRAKALYIIERDDIMTHDKVFSANTVCKFTERFIEKHGQKPIVIVDYLQLLQSSDSTVSYSERRTVDHNITVLWNLSHQHDIPVIVISSVGRENYEKAIGLASFKESGGIEFSADVVLGMQFPEAGQKDFDLTAAKRADPRRLELVILKNRYGVSSEKISFNYYPAYGFFEEAESEKPQAKKRKSRNTEKAPKTDYSKLIGSGDMLKGKSK